MRHYDKALAEGRLKQLRNSKNWTLKEMGQKLNELIGYGTACDIMKLDGETGKHTVSQLEKGKRGITIDIAFAYANIFNVSLDYILGRSDDWQPENKEAKELTGLPDEAITTLKSLKETSENTDKRIGDRYIAHITLKSIFFLLNKENDDIFTLIGRYLWDRYSTDIKVKNEKTGEMTSRVEFMNETSGVKDSLLTDGISAAVFSRLQERIVEIKLNEEQKRDMNELTYFERVKREQKEDEKYFEEC